MKDKVISFRLPIPKYTALLTDAYNNGVSLNKYVQTIMDNREKSIQELQELKNQNSDLKTKNSDLNKSVSDQTKKISTLQNEVKKLKNQKPKVEVKEVEKIVTKTITDDKKVKEVTKSNNLLKKELDQSKKKIKELENLFHSSEEEKNELTKFQIQSEKSKDKLKKELDQLKKFINDLDLRKHSDGYSLGGRTFSEGSKIKF